MSVLCVVAASTPLLADTTASSSSTALVSFRLLVAVSYKYVTPNAANL